MTCRYQIVLYNVDSRGSFGERVLKRVYKTSRSAQAALKKALAARGNRAKSGRPLRLYGNVYKGCASKQTRGAVRPYKVSHCGAEWAPGSGVVPVCTKNVRASADDPTSRVAWSLDRGLYPGIRLVKKVR